MIEDEARAWVRDHFGVPRETLLEDLAAIVRVETVRQNLIAPSTIDSIWARHIVDSAQLLEFLPRLSDGQWIDIGTGAGFPGLVIACLRDAPIVLVEPRRRRAEFLEAAIDRLGIAGRARVAPVKAEALRDHGAILSARAVAPLDALFAAAAHLSDRETVWLLPKGRSAREEVAVARKTWQGSFHVEQSLTQPDSLVVVATGVRRR